MTRLVFGFLCMLLTGCATTAGFEQILQSYVGTSEDNLVQHWGPPQSTYQMTNGMKVISYVEGGSASTVYNPYLRMSTTQTNYCKADFYVDSLSVIKSWRWEGNSCRAMYSAPTTPRETASDAAKAKPKDPFAPLNQAD